MLAKGYAFLAIGYFNANGAPKHLDRISLNAIADTILNIAAHPNIDQSNIALIGGSKGGVLNLASRFDHFKAVIALSTSHVSFPALTWSANTSSWTHDGKEIPYMPATLKTIGPALKGDLYSAFSIMLEDEEQEKQATIPVENINASILLISGNKDEQWPATSMSNKIIDRLSKNNFEFFHQHIVLEGGHVEPLEQFDLTMEFLEEHMPVD